MEDNMKKNGHPININHSGSLPKDEIQKEEKLKVEHNKKNSKDNTNVKIDRINKDSSIELLDVLSQIYRNNRPRR